MLAALLLAAALASPAAARAWPDCLHIGAKKSPPKSLAQLRACQKRAAAKIEDRAAAKGKPLSGADLDALGEHQRAEARKFLATGVVTEGTSAEPKREQASDQGSSGENGAGGEEHALSPAAMGTASNQIRQRFISAGIRYVPPETVSRLTDAVQATGGKITPAVDRMVDEEINSLKSAPDGGEESDSGDSSPGSQNSDPGSGDDGSR